MSYNSDIATYKAQIDNDISTQSLPNSIPPDVVGSGYTDLADLLAPYINSINNNAILSGVGVPSALIGNDLDIYYNTQPTYFELYRKESSAWVLKVTVPFGINLPDGPATLRTFIDGTTASVTKGGWFINNAVYNKLTQTIFTVPAADATFSRTDLIYADTSNTIQYLTGTPSLTPVDPTLPANTIAVDYVLVPSVASGFDPYLRFGSTTEQNGLSVQNDTGALTYGGISVASGTTVNIGACTGYVVDNETTPGDSTMVFINYPGETNKTVTTLGSGIGTYVLLNSLGVIVFQNTFPTSAQRKTHIYLSKIGHPTGTINTAGDEVDFVLSPLAQHRDLFQAITYINNGVVPSASGATLNFQISTGEITGDGINFVTDKTNPNNYTVPPQPTASFLPRTQTGAGGAFTSTVDVANYDVAGTITSIPGGANTSTIRYIYYVPPLGLIVQYGQTTYASLTDAIAAVGKETFTIYPSLVRNAILIGVLVATKSATALNDAAQARFLIADKFGQLGGASAGISTGTLQTGYNNSLQPQITTTTALGAVQFKRGSTLDTDNVFQVLNGAGTASFSVTGNGNTTVGGRLSINGGVEGTYSPIINGVSQIDQISVTPNFNSVNNGSLTSRYLWTLSNDGLSNVNVQPLDVQLSMEKSSGSISGNSITVIQGRYLQNGSISPDVTVFRAILQGSTASTITSLSLFGGLNSAYTNTQSITTFRHFNAASCPINVVDASGLFIGSSLSGSSSTKAIDLGVTSGTGKWNVFAGGTAANHLLGDTMIGTSTLSSFKLDVNGNSRILGRLDVQGAVLNVDRLFGINFFAYGSGPRSSIEGSSNNDINIKTTTGGVFRYFNNTIEYLNISTGGNVLLQNGGTYTDDATNRLQVSGSGIFKGGAEALKVSTATGNPDHAYIGLYARTATPTVRSASIGYTAAATNTLTIDNQLGQVAISTAVSNSAITLRVPGTAGIITVDTATFSVTPPTAATQGWFNGIGLSGTISNSNVLSLTTGLSTLTSGSRVMLRTNSGGASPSATASGNAIGEYSFGGYSGTTYYDSSKIIGVATETHTGSAGGSKLDFYTTPNGTVAQVKAMTIDQDGKITTPVGTLQVGLTFSEVIDFPSIGANSNNTQTFASVSGVAVGDFPILSYDNAADNASIIYKVRIPAANTIQVEAYNLSGGSIDIPSATFNVRVLKF